MAADTEQGYGLRKRRRLQQASEDGEASLEQLLEVAENCEKIVVFSGSGLSASSGMSTFSTRGGLYERAQKKYKLSDGKMLFTYLFFDRQRTEAQAFFADIYSEALRAEPAPGHHALRALFDAGRLQRHYTMNIDGLAEEVGMSTWHHERNTQGVTVEMHGNVRHLVCPECHATLPMTSALAKQIKERVAVPCAAPDCSHGALRFKVMMYDDGEAECITPDDVMELMEDDVKAADLVLWVGISFQQSASTVYFRKVRCWIQAAGRLDETVQAVVNPSDEALFNLRTAMSNQSELRVMEVLAEADEVLPVMADRLSRRPQMRGAGKGTPGATAVPPSRRRTAAGIEEKVEVAGVKQEGAAGWLPPHPSPAAIPAAAIAAAACGVQQPSVAQQQQQQQQIDARPQHTAVLPLATLQQLQQLHPFLAQHLHHAPPPAAPMTTSQALLQAVGFPGAAAVRPSLQQHQATVQTLETLSQVLLRAIQSTASAVQQQQQQHTQQQQQQHAWLPQLQQQPQTQQAPDMLAALMMQAVGGMQPAVGLGQTLLPLLLLQQQMQQQQQQQLAAAALSLPTQLMAPRASLGAALASPVPAPSSAGGPTIAAKQSDSPRDGALPEQDSHDSEQNHHPPP